MAKLPEFSSIKDIKYGTDPHVDAWLLYFMTSNNLEHFLDPLKNASPEQLRFMVALEDGQVFAPCSDWQFRRLITPGKIEELNVEYAQIWKLFTRLVCTHVTERYRRRLILGLCRLKFRQALDSTILIPWRLLKGMITIFLAHSGLDDPYTERKSHLFNHGVKYVESDFFTSVMKACPYPPLKCECLADMRFELDMIELGRLLRLSTLPDAWRDDLFHDDWHRYSSAYSADKPDYSAMREIFKNKRSGMKILYLPGDCGSLMVDLLIIRSLIRQGHNVVLSLKEGFCFDKTTFWDRENNPALAEALKDAYFLTEDRISKNGLLATLRENPFVVISDGTRERLNLIRCSVTFARAWKESDLILARGYGNSRRLVRNSHGFTRDVISFFRKDDGRFRIEFKPKSESVRQISESEIRAKADEIIAEMQKARGDGKTVMFYSAIVGSIPGQVDTAINILNTFVKYLRSRLDGTYIINPAEHFEEGMDADDLMYMWERVQRSGYISVWRFQSYGDIEKSFELMQKKVPPVWAGKDATYSTGCTKEMRIALDVQSRQPELQIIGPSPERFSRRREYGVGRFSDVVIGS
ncbi:hypothetical protein [Maridesulfovibrio bastinii]|uniref:hypothetical protein n=1 Tax=Maridesulfovibrio bastinii TaxID=47157 RepID=UPI0004271F58|nr:hypothetical protein [Maridesulfovibrio bastinii]